MPAQSFCVLCRGTGYVMCSRCRLPVCRKCRQFIGNENICSKCRKADLRVPGGKGRDQKLAKMSAIFVGTVLGFGLLAILDQNPRYQPSPNPLKAPSTIDTLRQNAEDEFKKMSPAQHLDAAEDLLFADTSREDIETLKKHLAAIPAEAPESKEVSALTEEADARLKLIEEDEEAARRQTEIESEPLQVVSSDWSKEGASTVAFWRITLKNRSKRPVGNIKFYTEYFSETGKMVFKRGVNRVLAPGVIQKVVAPLSSRTIEINDGYINREADTARFYVVGWEFVEDRR